MAKVIAVDDFDAEAVKPHYAPGDNVRAVLQGRRAGGGNAYGGAASGERGITQVVMAALDAAIQGKQAKRSILMDGRVKPGHDNSGME